MEYGLAIATLRAVDYKALEKIQDSCLRMIFGGHRAASTMVFTHLTNLPSMRFRADTLVAKYCLRAEYLPKDCLLSQLCGALPNSSLAALRGRHMYQAMPDGLKSGASASSVSTWLRKYRQESFDSFLASTTKVLIRACRPVLKVDPVMYVPASRADRSRLIRWRMGWLPGKPKPCPCLLDRTTRHHLRDCILIPFQHRLALPAPPDLLVHPIDHALNQLPVSRSAPCPSFWVDLCTILWHIDQLCNPEGDYSNDPPPGQVWSSLVRSSPDVSLVLDEQ
jgi:hypothetical protein